MRDHQHSEALVFGLFLLFPAEALWQLNLEGTRICSRFKRKEALRDFLAS